ncbi:MAG: nickel pincer cofactor biosynthesis protein LarB [Candidatus Hydrothermarchaeaceae archaeon]
MSLRRILEDYEKGKISVDEAEREVRLFNIAKIGHIGVIDTHRENRTGVPEVIFGESKTDRELASLIKRFVGERGRCIVTRLTSGRMTKISKNLKGLKAEKNEKAGAMVIYKKGQKVSKTGGRVAVLCAGTSDIGRAEEAALISREMGCEVITFYDIGVAGIHRMIPAIEGIIKKDVDAVVVAAGMEGALPSVVAGLVDVPVIGLPISTGYGEGGKGRAALYSMLQSCSPGLATVNIDNGFGAGVMAALIANRAAKFRNSK